MDTKDKKGADSKPADTPAPTRSYEDRVAFQQAFAGVKPLKGETKAVRQAPPSPPELRDHGADEEARERLDSLVGGAYRFKIERADGYIAGLRAGMHASYLQELDDQSLVIDDECDLHGLKGREAKRIVTSFVREQAAAGARVVLVIHGKGRHSAGGKSVLRDITVEALTQGASPVVAAFRTAPARLGGSGATAVRLTTMRRTPR